MDDPAVTAALAAAAQRGVDVTVVMTADPEWDTVFAEWARAGAYVRLYAGDSSSRYIHAKAIVPYQDATAAAAGYSHTYRGPTAPATR